MLLIVFWQQEGDVNAVERNEITALMFAAQGGHVPITDHLVVHGTEFHHRSINDWNALMLAAHNCHFEAVDRFFSLGCEINAQSSEEKTPLQVVCHYGSIEMVEHLLSLGGDVNTRIGSESMLIWLYQRDIFISLIDSSHRAVESIKRRTKRLL